MVRQTKKLNFDVKLPKGRRFEIVHVEGLNHFIDLTKPLADDERNKSTVKKFTIRNPTEIQTRIQRMN